MARASKYPLRSRIKLPSCGPSQGEGLGRPGLGLAVPGATAGHATSVHAVAVDPISPRKKFL